jgi:6-pyruvoyltetrahydropterin/6-carboxytetrahydropterin synthase
MIREHETRRMFLGPGQTFTPARTVYRSTKTYGHELGLSCAFRQWRAESHCRFLHGYALAVRIEFEAAELDGNNWVVDFGSLKPFKDRLAGLLDHKTLVAADDPELARFYDLHAAGIIDMILVEATGCEALAALVFNMATNWITESGYAPRVRVASVEVMEHGANSAVVTAP